MSKRTKFAPPKFSQKYCGLSVNYLASLPSEFVYRREKFEMCTVALRLTRGIDFGLRITRLKDGDEWDTFSGGIQVLLSDQDMQKFYAWFDDALMSGGDVWPELFEQISKIIDKVWLSVNPFDDLRGRPVNNIEKRRPRTMRLGGDHIDGQVS